MKHSVFWPPVVLIVGAVLMSIWNQEAFKAWTGTVNTWLLSHFASTITWGALLVFLTCLVAYASPLGKTTLGGKGAPRVLTPFSWFAVALCVNTAVGILFWAAAEPMYHLSKPPVSLGLEPSSRKAAVFALSTLYMHWSLIPCAIYALPALVFGLAFYNQRKSFTLASCLSPIGIDDKGRFSAIVDSLCVFSLVTGMAASMGTGVLTLAGGFEYMGWAKSTPIAWIWLGSAIVACFLASSISGLERGIKWLSLLNTYGFALLFAVAVIWGPLAGMFSLGSESLVDYLTNFFSRSLLREFSASDKWPQDWTVFYWAVWLAWAPVTALFLGRIGRGYTVRQFLLVNLFFPALFAILWMTVFGGTTLHMELQGAGLVKLLEAKGPESLAYALLEKYPLSSLLVPFFLLTVFISYVTSADSNTTVIAGLCSSGIAPECPEPKVYLKVIWGVTMGAVTLVAICSSGVDGIRTLSYLGGFPALIFELLTMFGLWKMVAASFGRAPTPITETVPT